MFKTESKAQSHIGPCTQPQTPHLMGLSGWFAVFYHIAQVALYDTDDIFCISDRCRGDLVALDEMQEAMTKHLMTQGAENGLGIQGKPTAVERVVCCCDERFKKWCKVL